MSKRTVRDTPTFVEKAVAVHQGRYAYTRAVYTASRGRLTITCTTHGDFEQVAADHLRGVGCPVCANNQRLTTKTFIARAIEVHGDRYGYEHARYSGGTLPVDITCPEHGVFSQVAENHLSGRGCAKCAGKSLKTNDQFLEDAKKVHGDRYDYSKTDYRNALKKVTITCTAHGDFEQTPNNHLSGFGCAHCAGCAPKKHEVFLEEANEIHAGRYTYNSPYVRATDKVEIVCAKHGSFLQRPQDHIHLRQGCPECWSNRSSYEIALEAFLTERGITVVTNDRRRLNSHELDLVLPEYNLAIEINGLRFHNDRMVPKNYHYAKWKACRDVGLRLLHVNEDEWLANSTAICNRILNLCGRSERGVGARKLIVRRIEAAQARSFTEKHHIQGRVQIVEDAFGAFQDERLVAIVTFSRQRGTGHIELSRFCTDGPVYPGVFSKITAHAIRENGYTHIVSFADRRYSNGDLYEKTGFTYTGDTPIDYRYVKGKRTFSKRSFTKTDIEARFGLSGQTEREMMQSLGYDRIYDCGKMRFEWTETK